MSSSWRYTRNAQYLKELLLQYNITTDSTPFLQNKRGLEIKKYLENNTNVEDFVILDDEIFDSYDKELLKKLIKISNGNEIDFGDGLQQKDIDQIIQRLGKKRQINEDELEI